MSIPNQENQLKTKKKKQVTIYGKSVSILFYVLDGTMSSITSNPNKNDETVMMIQNCFHFVCTILLKLKLSVILKT